MIRVWITVAIITAIGGLGWYGYRYVNNLQDQLVLAETNLATARINETLLKDSLETASRAIANYQKDVAARDAVIAAINDKFDEFRQAASATEQQIQERDLGALSRADIKATQDLINNISRDMHRCIEVASGAVVTETVSNPECPSLIRGKE